MRHHAGEGVSLNQTESNRAAGNRNSGWNATIEPFVGRSRAQRARRADSRHGYGAFDHPLRCRSNGRCSVYRFEGKGDRTGRSAGGVKFSMKVRPRCSSVSIVFFRSSVLRSTDSGLDFDGPLMGMKKKRPSVTHQSETSSCLLTLTPTTMLAFFSGALGACAEGAVDGCSRKRNGAEKSDGAVPSRYSF